MNTMIHRIAGTAILSVVMLGSAHAMTPTNESVWSALQSSSFQSHALNVSVNDGVVTLSGDVEDALVRHQAEMRIRHIEGVTGVINLVTAN